MYDFTLETEPARCPPIFGVCATSGQTRCDFPSFQLTDSMRTVWTHIFRDHLHRFLVMIQSLDVSLSFLSNPYSCEHDAEHRQHRIHQDNIVYDLCTDAVVNDDELCDGEQGRNDKVRDGDA